MHSIQKLDVGDMHSLDLLTYYGKVDEDHGDHCGPPEADKGTEDIHDSSFDGQRAIVGDVYTNEKVPCENYRLNYEVCLV